MRVQYDQLRKLARKGRAELFEKGEFVPNRQKVRRKPRSQEEAEALYERAVARTARYKPYRDKDGTLILPYFST